MAVLSLRLLGDFEAHTASGERIPLPGRKAAALLAYLALHADRPVSRDRLAQVLWGSKDHAAARANLRQTLTALRKALPEECLTAFSVDGETLTAHGAALDVDATALRALEDGGGESAIDDPVAVYRGEFLEGIRICEPAFDEWLREARDDLHRCAVRVLSRELARLEADGASENAIDAAKRLLSLEPHDESVHRALMSLYAETGRNGLALAQYEACRDHLQRELGVPPEPATTALSEAIRLKRRSDAASSDTNHNREPGSASPGVEFPARDPPNSDGDIETDDADPSAGHPVRNSKHAAGNGPVWHRQWFVAVGGITLLLFAGAFGWLTWDRVTGPVDDEQPVAAPSAPRCCHSKTCRRMLRKITSSTASPSRS